MWGLVGKTGLLLKSIIVVSCERRTWGRDVFLKHLLRGSRSAHLYRVWHYLGPHQAVRGTGRAAAPGLMNELSVQAEAGGAGDESVAHGAIPWCDSDWLCSPRRPDSPGQHWFPRRPLTVQTLCSCGRGSSCLVTPLLDVGTGAFLGKPSFL